MTTELPRDLVKRVIDRLTDYDDCGPPGEGWQSELLMSDIAAMEAALAAPTAKGGTEVTLAAIEAMAEHLLEEDHEPGWTWPTHRDDDGYRGGGYVTIAPPDVQSHLLDKARRVLIRAAQITADPRAASPPPPAGAAGGGAGDLGAPMTERESEAPIYEAFARYVGNADERASDFRMFATGYHAALSVPAPDLGAQGEPVWVKKYKAECQRTGVDFNVQASIAENFPQIVAPQQPAAQGDPVAREAILAVVRAAWALVDNTGHHDWLPLAINRDDWNDLAARLAALKVLLPAEELPADPPHAVAYFWPTSSSIDTEPTPDLGAQGDLVARSEIAKWRDDAFEKSAEIARRYGDPCADDVVRDILALRSVDPRAARERQPKATLNPALELDAGGSDVGVSLNAQGGPVAVCAGDLVAVPYADDSGECSLQINGLSVASTVPGDVARRLARLWNTSRFEDNLSSFTADYGGPDVEGIPFGDPPTHSSDPFLRAVVTVQRDDTTVCSLSFGRGVKFPLGQAAIRNAVKALQAEIADSDRCPASTAPTPDLEAQGEPVAREVVAGKIQAIAEQWRGANGGIYTIRAMSLEMADLFLALIAQADRGGSDA